MYLPGFTRKETKDLLYGPYDNLIAYYHIKILGTYYHHFNHNTQENMLMSTDEILVEYGR